MARVYKTKDGLAISIPRDIVKSLEIRPGDDLDFIAYKDRYYIIAKRSDIARLITGNEGAAQKTNEAPAANAQPAVPELSLQEISVLKKLDTLRYNMRTTPEVAKILDEKERGVFKDLIKKKVITPFKDENQKTHYSIQKRVYDSYLMRKGKPQYSEAAAGLEPVAIQSKPVQQNAIELYISKLQKNGFVVVPTESEASAISAALEDSIRRGVVVGTRAFNKKFYIVMRSFINSTIPQIMAIISKKSMQVSEIAKECKMQEEAVRSVLYVIAESGEVTEVRKDIFRAA